MRTWNGVMDVPRYPRLNPAFMRFYARFASLFGRIDTRQRSAQYMQGLLMERTVRRNAANLAARSGTASPRAFQHLRHDSLWEHRRMIDALHAVVAPYLNGDDGIWVLEDIGFSKRRRCSRLAWTHRRAMVSRDQAGCARRARRD